MNKGGETLPRLLLFAMGVVAIARLATLAGYPLMDTTEARYAEIARKMAELGDWTTPWFDYGVPFWGKPPLSFWLTAGSFELFGVGEFAARVPHWLGGMLLAWLLWGWLARRSRREAAYAVALLLGSALYVVAAGAVTTDMALAVGVTLAMRGFWLGMHGTDAERVRERWFLFGGIAVGMLAKGPVALVLIGLPMLVWTVATRNLRLAWTALPWLRGGLAATVIVLPWYVLAELRTPGFLDYFLVGEHWLRFIVPGWKGDLYGTAHEFPRGTIWGFAFVALLPWSVLLPAAALRLRGAAPMEMRCADAQWRLYVLLWGLAPCLFFTLAGNILWTYVLPGLPGLATWAAGWLAQYSPQSVNRVLVAGLIVTLLGLTAFVANVQLGERGERNSAKELIAGYESRRSGDEGLVYLGKRPYSAAFYSFGKAEWVANSAQLARRLEQRPAFAAVDAGTSPGLPPALLRRLQHVRQYGRFDLFAPSRPPNEAIKSAVGNASEASGN